MVSKTSLAADVGVPVDSGHLGSSTSSGLGAPDDLGQPLENEFAQLPESLSDVGVIP